VKDDAGNPVVGKWEPIVEPDVWKSIHAIMTARQGRKVGPDGSIGDLLAADHFEHRYLLSGILRCGKPKRDGSICNVPLRARWVGGKNDIYHYICPPKTQGGCSGIGRDGAKTDEYLSEMVLAKLEEREMRAVHTEEWAGAAELETCQRQLDELSREWRAGGISNEFFFANVRQLEQKASELRADQARYVAHARRRNLDIEDVRRRWYAAEDQGGFDVMQKRAYIREALHAVIVHPTASQGRTPFNPDLLEPVWRED
jgi:hypothetical protein